MPEQPRRHSRYYAGENTDFSQMCGALFFQEPELPSHLEQYLVSFSLSSFIILAYFSFTRLLFSFSAFPTFFSANYFSFLIFSITRS